MMHGDWYYIHFAHLWYQGICCQVSNQTEDNFPSGSSQQGIRNVCPEVHPKVSEKASH